MTQTQPDGNQHDDFDAAVQAVTRAVRAINNGTRGGDGGEFVTHLLAAVAANLGSSYAVTQARPGSWEADKVLDMLHSTVGVDDEFLLEHRTEPLELVANIEELANDVGVNFAYDASVDYIGRRMFGERYESVVTRYASGMTQVVARAQLTSDELEQMEEVDELLFAQQEADLADLKQRFSATAVAEFDRLRQEDPSRYPAHLTVSVRFIEEYDGLTDAWGTDLASRLYEHARLNTPVPGSNLRYADLPSDRPGRAALGAGHWPHLRVPQLAHYDTPTTTKED